MRKFVVGSLEFAVVGDVLTYSPTRGARFYQAFVAGCIGWLSVFGAYLVLSFEPFSKLGDWPRSWDTGAAVALAVFGIVLFIAGQIYLRTTSGDYLLDKQSQHLSRNSKLARDMTLASAIVVLKRGGSVDVNPTWSVGSRNSGKDRGLPRLTFESESDALRVAQEISSFLGLPILS